MENSYTKIDENLSTCERKEIWEISEGLNKVDNLTQSKYFKESIKKEILGKATYKEVREELNNKFKNDTSISKEEKEADLVAIRMAELLSRKSGSFRFNIESFKNIHAFIFQDVFSQLEEKYLGKFRDYNISKDEAILNGESVIYSDYLDLENNLKYDFEKEEKFDYVGNSQNNIIKNISSFTSSIWQIHPFIEGNTRTTAIFIEKYMRSKRFDIATDIFKDNSLYFRNSLVLANYENPHNKYLVDCRFIYIFFEKILYNKFLELPIIKL